MNINNNINSLRQKVPVGCKLIAVSKTQPPEKIMEAYDAGQRVFGENKVQELVTKHAALPEDIEWHMIGHLQTNKVKSVIPFAALIHGVDSFRLLEEINKQGEKQSKVVDCLLQVFIAKEETKFGFDQKEVLEMMSSDKFRDFRNIRVVGLMGMATFTENKDVIRDEFRSLKAFFDQLSKSQLPANVAMKELSMGMSSDYAIAIEEGSTMVRIGTAIFGNRNYTQ
jgi:PLP dependent protein